MDGMIDSNESCIYCSKSLYGLNDFNKRMHSDTCKVRRLVESNFVSFHHHNQQHHQQHLQASSSTGAAAVVAASNSSPSVVPPVVINNHVNNASPAFCLEDYMMLGDSCPYCFKSLKVQQHRLTHF